MPLPHNLEYHDISAANAVESLRRDPKKDVVFAVSQGFYDDDDSNMDEVCDTYEEFFEKKRQEIIAVLGQPNYDGSWIDDAYPVYAIGDRITVWGSGDSTMYLRYFHEDKEVGVVVSLLTPQSPHSNHEAQSYYEAVRKYAKEAGAGDGEEF